ncbi:hypothetical protein K402DRAFT_396193 [Aulographum hederae CBS 113979]|uniref:Uncharacterized protein n=1 Tax=Aulographum hederae CBS 113979 TaxID=1176131 RepID=A0A6G1GTC0_9PEZI|nr:hypothetical protein K402DRAFT_396193 [Aulographum hederae CBS 113979]
MHSRNASPLLASLPVAGCPSWHGSSKLDSQRNKHGESAAAYLYRAAAAAEGGEDAGRLDSPVSSLPLQIQFSHDGRAA